MPRNMSSTAPKSLSPRVTPAKRAPLWIRGFKPNRRKFLASGKKVFPRLCWPPLPRFPRGRQAIKPPPQRRKRRQSRTGHGRGSPISAIHGEKEPRPIRRQNPDGSPDSAEAEFLRTRRKAKPFGQSVKQQSHTRSRRAVWSAKQSCFDQIFPKGGDLPLRHIREGDEDVAGTEGSKRSRALCQEGRKHFFQIVKRPDQKSRRSIVHNSHDPIRKVCNFPEPWGRRDQISDGRSRSKPDRP
jgi:hypothetical protein